MLTAFYRGMTGEIAFFLRLAACAVVTVVISFVASRPLLAQDPSGKPTAYSDEDLEFFEKEIRPIFVTHCLECHGPDEQEASLRLDSRAAIMQGGDTGPAIVLDAPEKSLLLEVVGYEGDIQMPPASKLPAAKIDLLKQWIKRGAPWPTETSNADTDASVFDLKSRFAEHWCWHAPKMPPVPTVNQLNWDRDPIDRFILQRLETAGLQPAGDADRQTLIRRLYFALIGLPPTPEAIAKFVADESPQALERVVDELLASPRFGEHWARHWMDLMRYAETHGHEFDYPIPNAFQFRDYLIRAFNADVPYNEFVREHIAGDLLPSPRLNAERKFNESVLGTGFWFLGEATHGPVDVREDEAGHIDNQIDVMTKTFLGLTVACARCHDHKFDAISTEDYYALSGFLQSSRRQTVLLDMNQKIASGIEELQSIRERVDSDFVSWNESLRRCDVTRLQQILATAIGLARTKTNISSATHMIEGESLRADLENKNVSDQHLPPQNDFAWSGDHQLWWREGKEGERITLSFSVPETKKYSVAYNLTQARDYGIVKIWLDDSENVQTIDCFSQTLKTTGKRKHGTSVLEKGQHRLNIEIVGHHPEAIPRRMFGLDYLVLESAESDTAELTWKRELDAAAANLKIESDQLLKVVSALQSSEIKSPQHPLYALNRLSSSTAEESVLKKLREECETKPNSTAILFTDFTDATDWSSTGWAFARKPSSDFELSPDGSISAADVVTSGSLGSSLQGSIRSPTFELAHDQIHYRIRGENVQIRLIIDGFTMDVFNALLFERMSITIPNSSAFQWVTQAGDLKNYRGHRAYIEINDLGNGWCVLDKIAFSNDGPPAVEVHPLNQAMLQDLTNVNPESLASGFAASAIQLLSQTDIAAKAELLTWIAANDLEFCFASGDSKGGKITNGWKKQLAEMVGKGGTVPAPVQAIGMTDGSPEDEYVFVRGNHKLVGPLVPRRSLTALLDDPQRYQNLRQSGRLEFANEIVAPTHPLTARVMVNRLWHHLFGRGIVASVDNFGALGSKPTHPELLDYLALEFVRDDWSLKRMIKRMVMSRTFALSSTPSDEAKKQDPDNDLLQSFRIRRLSGEEIRDAILQTSEELDTSMYGPSVPIYLTEFMQGRGRPGGSGPLDGARRRSVYIETRRNFLNPMMLAFDMPIPFNAIGRRNVSNVPAQALILMNDPFVIDQAQKWATKVIQNSASGEERIALLFKRAIGRPPTADELKLCRQFIEEEVNSRKIPEAEIDRHPELWRDFCHVLFNLKSFTFVY